MRRMFRSRKTSSTYITVMNEELRAPEMPKGAEADIIQKGMYSFKKGGKADPRVQLLGSGTIFREVIAAAEMLKADWGVEEADLWGCPPLQRTGWTAGGARWNLLPAETPEKSHVEACLGAKGPVVAATDPRLCRANPSQLRQAHTSPWAPTASVAPTPGSAAPPFEVDRRWVTLAALKAPGRRRQHRAGKGSRRPGQSTTSTRTSQNPLSV